MTINSFKTLVIVPAYNEEKSIRFVIDDLYVHAGPCDVLVVNDGSRDGTPDLVRADGRARLVNLPVNLGIGGAVQTGLLYAVRKGYDAAIQFDGDGQHKASEIPKLLGPLEKGTADMVIGSRFFEVGDTYKSTALRRIGIKYFELLNWLVIGKRIKDNTSGFRGYGRKALSFIADIYPHDYPEPEAVILLGKNGFRIAEVFTEMRERQGGVSSISGCKSVYYMIKVTLAVLINCLRATRSSGHE